MSEMNQTGQVKQFVSKVDLANPDVVGVLEDALARARSGHTKGILLLEQDGKATSYSTVGLADRYHIIGYLQCAMHNLLA